MIVEKYGHSWRARISGEGGVAGAGVVLGSETILTCAHVVASALDVDAAAGAPSGQVQVDFPGSGSVAAVCARVADWVPVATDGGGDLALLTPGTALPADVRPAPLRRWGRLAGQRVRAYGHPPGLEGGAWTRGELVDVGGPWRGWVQIDGLDLVGRAVTAGFSGAGVLDRFDQVIGLLVARDRQRDLRVAWMVPTEVIADAFAAVAALVLPHGVGDGPTGDARPAVAALQRIARALSQVAVMRDSESRQRVVDALRPAISGSIPRHGALLMDVYSIVVTCLEHPGGLTELMALIQGFSGDETALATVNGLLTETGLYE